MHSLLKNSSGASSRGQVALCWVWSVWPAERNKGFPSLRLCSSGCLGFSLHSAVIPCTFLKFQIKWQKNQTREGTDRTQKCESTWGSKLLVLKAPEAPHTRSQIKKPTNIYGGNKDKETVNNSFAGKSSCKVNVVRSTDSSLWYFVYQGYCNCTYWMLKWQSVQQIWGYLLCENGSWFLN